MKKELLIPVGSMEALNYAIHNGADAVYLGGKSFGARKFANNFTNEEMLEAICLCHLYGVKIYVTANTLIYDDEVEEFLSYIKFLYQNGVDAVIMQDFGMICLVRNIFPDLEIHASTQLHNYSKSQLEFLKKLGIKRVVLARELSLDEIRKIDTDMELEVFIHGALCISYSGCCLFSSLVGGRSGNRGECAGSCRLPYQLLEDGKVVSTDKYLLSTKELNTSPYFEELMRSNITSFKVEGRMKSPEYVGFITKFYRNLIDQYEKTGKIRIDNNCIEKLKILFNREFTKGHLFNEKNYELMNMQSPNHIGICIGKVEGFIKNKIKIKLEKDLTQGDGIRFLESNKGMIVNFLYNKNEKLIHEAKRDDIIFLDNKIGLTSLDLVHKTISSKLSEELKKYSKRMISVSMKLEAKIGKKLCLTIEDYDKNVVKVFLDNVEEARSSPTSRERIVEQLKKLGNTPFDLKSIDVIMDDNIFLSIKVLNDIRRTAVEQLIKKRTSLNKLCRILPCEFKTISNDDKNTNLTVLVRNEEQLQTCMELKFNRIYVDDFHLYQKYHKNSSIYYEVPRTNNEKYDFTSLLVTELGGILSENNKVGDYTLNVTNSYTVYYLYYYGLSTVTLSVELADEKLRYLINNYYKLQSILPSLEKIIYGRVDLMIMKHCLINSVLQKGNKPCSLCRNRKKYQLKDRKGVCFPIVTKGEITHILSNCIDEIAKVEAYRDWGIRSFRLQLFDEDAFAIRELYDRLCVSLKK